MDSTTILASFAGLSVTILTTLVSTAFAQGKLNQRVDYLNSRQDRIESLMAEQVKDTQRIAITLERICTILEEDSRAHK